MYNIRMGTSIELTEVIIHDFIRWFEYELFTNVCFKILTWLWESCQFDEIL